MSLHDLIYYSETSLLCIVDSQELMSPGVLISEVDLHTKVYYWDLRIENYESCATHESRIQFSSYANLTMF